MMYFGLIQTPILFHLTSFSRSGPKTVMSHPALRRHALTTHDLA